MVNIKYNVGGASGETHASQVATRPRIPRSGSGNSGSIVQHPNAVLVQRGMTKKFKSALPGTIRACLQRCSNSPYRGLSLGTTFLHAVVSGRRIGYLKIGLKYSFPDLIAIMYNDIDLYL